ncbi:MAG: CPBP family intramembrane metalloprotease [Planctomycetes bacterium]|nr:CPBP family intramembrane metalloprotease [Planctomycetota bacterium]
MSWRNVKLIFLREVLDQLRDRRTLFMVAVLPLLLYPLMGIGMFQMTTLFSEQPRTVVILGANDLPALPLLNGDRFARTWFRISTDADKLRVISDANPAPDQPPLDKAEAESKARLLERAQQMKQLIARRVLLETKLEQAREAKRPVEVLNLEAELQTLTDPLGQMFHNSDIQVLIVIPRNFKANLERLRDELAQRGSAEKSLVSFDYPRPVIVQNSADEKSVIAHNRVTDVMREWERSLLRSYLRESGLPEHLPTPVNPTAIDLAVAEQMSASVWSKLFPSLLVIMALTGAFYPAVDLGAGEKERGTMETLLICPATRTEIVLGKFLTVMLFSASTALLNLSSLGFTGRYMASLASGGGMAGKFGDLALPPLASLAWILVMLIPLASLFSALCLAFATFARSSKEGQYYLTPLLMVTMGLTVFCSSPGVEIEPFYSVMPVMGPALLLKGLLKATGPATDLYLYAIPVLLTSIGYSLVALWWAIEQFGREEVLFREAERFDLRLWVKHLLRDKEPTPSFTEAGFCFLVILLLQFLSMKSMQGAMQGIAEGERGLLQVRLVLIQQLALIATPALLMGVMLTTSMRQTFSLRWPGFGRLGCAMLLPFALHPLSYELGRSLEWFFPKPPPGLVEALKSLSGDSVPLWLLLLALAVAPAICEEIAFRGFMLSGFSRGGKVSLAVALSSLAFGIIHMIPQQVFNAALLGVVLGMMCVRSRSLLPGIAFHLIYNAMGVLHGPLGSRISDEGIWSWLFRHDQGALRYQPVLLCLAALAAIGLLHRLTRHPNAHATAGKPDPMSDDGQQSRPLRQVDDRHLLNDRQKLLIVASVKAPK